MTTFASLVLILKDSSDLLVEMLRNDKMLTIIFRFLHLKTVSHEVVGVVK